MVPLPLGVVTWYVEAVASDCPSAKSTSSVLRVVPAPQCGIPAAPTASVVGEVTSGESYKLLWDRVPGATIYEVQGTSNVDLSSGHPDFAGATVIPTTSFLEFTAPQLGAGESSRSIYYRVRGIADCNQQRGPYSIPVAVVVTAAHRVGPGRIAPGDRARPDPLRGLQWPGDRVFERRRRERRAVGERVDREPDPD